MKIANKTIRKICFVLILIGTFTLSNFAHSKSQCQIDEYSLLTYLVDDDKVCGDIFSRRDIILVVKVLESYWDWNTTNEERFNLLSNDYKKILKKVYGVKKASEYLIPSTEYERIVDGYSILRIQSFNSKGLQVTTQIKWSQEGYQGTMTHIFEMVNINNKWLIGGIMN